MNPTIERVLRGTAAGLVGAWAMNLFQTAWSKAQRKGAEERQPSEDESATIQVAERISEGVFGHQLSAREKKFAGPLTHYAFGALIGALYGALEEPIPLVSRGAGLLYGTIVWLGADEGAVSALGFARPPSEYPALVHAEALASHLVYGATLFGVDRGLSRLAA